MSTPAEDHKMFKIILSQEEINTLEGAETDPETKAVILRILENAIEVQSILAYVKDKTGK